MKDREFNQNLILEHSLEKKLEFPNTREWKQSEDYRDKTLEFEKQEEYKDSDNKSQKKNGHDKKSKKKLMKMMLGTIGAVTIASSAGLFEQSSDHDHSRCVYSTEYNEFFDEFTSLMTMEDRALAAELIDSDEMKQWLKEISPSKERNRCSFIYNNEYVTNCHTEVYHNDYNSNSANLYFIVTVNDGEGYDGEFKNEYSVYLTPQLNMTKEYLEQADEIDVSYLRVMNYVKDQMGRGISIIDNWSQEKIDEILIRNNIQEMPPSVQFEKLTITGYLEGKNYQEIRDFAVVSSDEQVSYHKQQYSILCEQIKYGPDRNSPLTVRGRFVSNSSGGTYYEYMIDDSGQVTILQSYWTKSNGERETLPPEPGYQFYVNDLYSSLTRGVFALENQE